MADRRRFTLASPAKQDLVDFWTWIAMSGGAARADSVLERLRESCALLVHNPQMGRERPELREGIRSFAVSPQVVFYEATQRGVRVLRVIHGVRHLARALGRRPSTDDWTP